MTWKSCRMLKNKWLGKLYAKSAQVVTKDNGIMTVTIFYVCNKTPETRSQTVYYSIYTYNNRLLNLLPYKNNVSENCNNNSELIVSIWLHA